MNEESFVEHFKRNTRGKKKVRSNIVCEKKRELQHQEAIITKDQLVRVD
jgi:hypothetical protein